MRKLSENGYQSGKYHNMQVRKKMWFLTRSSIQLGRELERKKLKVMVEHHCSVRYVARIIVRGTICNIRVVETRSIVHKRCKQLGMLVITFLIFMQLLTTGSQITTLLSLRWKLSFVIKLFIFLLGPDLTIIILILTWWISVV